MTGAISRGWKSITSFHSSHTSLVPAVGPIVNLLPYLFFLWKPFFLIFWGNLTEFPMTKKLLKTQHLQHHTLGLKISKSHC
jgi:hypothetical protein